MRVLLPYVCSLPRCRQQLQISRDLSVVCTFTRAPGFWYVETTCLHCHTRNRLPALMYGEAAQQTHCPSRAFNATPPPSMVKEYEGRAGARVTILQDTNPRDELSMRRFLKQLGELPGAA